MEALVSRLESGDRTAFEQLCQALVSPDNEARRQAEDFYKQLLEHKPDLGVRFLAGGLSDDAVDLKHFCCVYLRKVCFPEHLHLSSPCCHKMKSCILPTVIVRI